MDGFELKGLGMGLRNAWLPWGGGGVQDWEESQTQSPDGVVAWLAVTRCPARRGSVVTLVAERRMRGL